MEKVQVWVEDHGSMIVTVLGNESGDVAYVPREEDATEIVELVSELLCPFHAVYPTVAKPCTAPKKHTRCERARALLARISVAEEAK